MRLSPAVGAKYFCSIPFLQKWQLFCFPSSVLFTKISRHLSSGFTKTRDVPLCDSQDRHDQFTSLISVTQMFWHCGSHGIQRIRQYLNVSCKHCDYSLITFTDANKVITYVLIALMNSPVIQRIYFHCLRGMKLWIIFPSSMFCCILDKPSAPIL